MTDRPNILVILSDQHSPHVLGCYGDDVVRTPHLDRLAVEGTRFTNCYCAAPVCGPSRMSFMTGRTPSHNRVWSNQHQLNPFMPTWAHVLSLAGYETSLLGRMHFEGAEQHHGFENRPIGEFFAVHPGVCGVNEKYPSGQDRIEVETSGHGTTTYQWMDDRITEATADYLHAHREQDRPFAAVVGYVLPHCPFIAPKELFDYYHDRVTIPPIEEDHPSMIRWYRRNRRQDEPPIAEKHVRAARAAYYALCEYTDRLVGQLLGALDESGLAENTIVIYASDHGEMAGEHGCWTKNVYYEASVGVPLIVRGPGVSAGGTSDANCSLMDLGATFAEIAGTDDVSDWDGRSIVPLLHGRDGGWINTTFSEVVDESTDPQIPSRMIRHEKWKLWVHLDQDGSMPMSLFDLDADPDELRDLADDPKYASMRDALLSRVMADWDPHAIQRDAMARREDYKILRRWGQAAQPRVPEQMDPPPDDLEDDVVIIT